MPLVLRRTRFGPLAAYLLLCVLFVGFGCDAPHAEARVQSSNQMKELILGVRNYHIINDEWPDDLGQVRELVDSSFDDVMRNPITGDDPGYEYVRPSADADPATTVILYQLRDGQHDTSLRVGFADGHVGEFDPLK